MSEKEKEDTVTNISHFSLSYEPVEGDTLSLPGKFEDYFDAAEAAFSLWKREEDFAQEVVDRGLTDVAQHFTPRTIAVMRRGEVISITDDGRTMDVMKPIMDKNNG